MFDFGANSASNTRECTACDPQDNERSTQQISFITSDRSVFSPWCVKTLGVFELVLQSAATQHTHEFSINYSCHAIGSNYSRPQHRKQSIAQSHSSSLYGSFRDNFSREQPKTCRQQQTRLATKISAQESKGHELQKVNELQTWTPLCVNKTAS